jgi:hypothetical protein
MPDEELPFGAEPFYLDGELVLDLPETPENAE